MEREAVISRAYELAKQMRPMIVRRVSPQNADDVIHDVVVAAATGFDRYGATIRDWNAYIAGIIFRTVTKARIQINRSEKLPAITRRQLPQVPYVGTYFKPPTPEAIVEQSEIRAVVRHGLEQLTPRQREVLARNYSDVWDRGKKRAQREMGLTYMQLSHELDRAIKHLRDICA